MKNLPDKIYLNFGEITKEEFETENYNEFCKLDEYAVTFCEDRVYDTDVEYVRKDAVIEKACELLARMIREVTYEDFKVNSVQHYDKIEFIEDFKKYMEGE